MITDAAFGVVPVCFDAAGKPQYLLIHQQKGHWAFPKGHAEGNEDALQAAHRELFEETGLRTERLLDAEPIYEHYQFTDPAGQVIDKTNTFYVGIIANDAKELTIQPEEVIEALWLPYEAVLERVTFPTSRATAQAAHQVVLNSMSV